MYESSRLSLILESSPGALVLLEQNLRRRSVERDRAQQINDANEQRDCRNCADEHPIPPNKIQVLAQVECALERLGLDVSGNSKSDVHRSISHSRIMLVAGTIAVVFPFLGPRG